MVDLIIDKFCEEYILYEIVKGEKTEIKRIKTHNYNNIIDYINENYNYARILCGNCIY